MLQMAPATAAPPHSTSISGSPVSNVPCAEREHHQVVAAPPARVADDPLPVEGAEVNTRDGVRMQW